MYFTGIVNSAHHWSRHFSLLFFQQLFFPFKLAFIHVLYFSFLCITVFEMRLFDAVESILFALTNCPWVSEDVAGIAANKILQLYKQST